MKGAMPTLTASASVSPISSTPLKPVPSWLRLRSGRHRFPVPGRFPADSFPAPRRQNRRSWSFDQIDRATPNPPPVKRAPISPGAPRAAATIASSSGEETSKLSRNESCEAAQSRPMLDRSPAASAFTIARTRWFSETTWPTRRAMTGSKRVPSSAAAATSTSRRLRIVGSCLASPARPCSHWDRRRLYAEAESWRDERVLQTTIAIFPIGASVRARLWQSISTALPAWPWMQIVWSMSPQATPTNWFSPSGRRPPAGPDRAGDR